MASYSFSSPPPPPYYAVAADPVDSPATDSVASALLIIFALLAFVCLASISIHAFLRYLSRSPSDSLPPPPLPRTDRRRADAAGDPAAASAERNNNSNSKEDEAGDEKQRLIESLPRFTMASALAALPKSSPDCAVCLSPFTPDAELRLLPACRHAFHAACVDAWLRAAAPTCPLCRAAVTLQQHPSVSAILAANAQTPLPAPETMSGGGRGFRCSRSFRVEMGSVVSSRGSSPADDSRTYSLGSFDYHIDEEVEAVVPRGADVAKEEKPSAAPGTPSAPGEAVAEAAGSSPSSTRGWLREYLDRFASSASSSFSFSGRWSSRWSQNNQGQRNEEPWLWDTEAAAAMPAAGPDEEETAFMVLYRWIAAV